jgi:hypothetical protein
MLKILIGQRLPETLIAVPRDPVRNASQFANIAGVSIMSASRFVNQLFERQFLHRRDDLLQIARVDELLDCGSPPTARRRTRSLLAGLLRRDPIK